jgi:MoaA/NifB/PqqE/SkfB family radical SAM enzyme
MLNALTYVTRRCPRHCEYCALRDAKDVGPELTTEQWKRAFSILKELGIEFNLILGNETWVLGDSLLEIMKTNKVPYALYTTCPEPLFSMYKDKFITNGPIVNLSCGVVYPQSYLSESLILTDDSERKSQEALKGFEWLKEKNPHTDCQGQITVHKGNLPYLERTVDELSTMGVFVGINFIHWNSDGGFDFFPDRKEIEYLLFKEEDIPNIRKTLDRIIEKPGLLQNPQLLKVDVAQLINMGWHCNGNPYGGPTIDADGTLRVCGYRKGTRTPKFTIFDLPEKIEEWREAVRLDAQDCPGCFWSYPWLFNYWNTHDGDMGREVFVKHAGDHIDKNLWAKRKIGDEKV